MNKNINISEKTAVLMRKATICLTLCLSATTLILIVLGFVPNFDQSANAWKMFGNLLEVFSIGTKPLMFCLLRFGFATCYFILVFFVIRDLIAIIQNIKRSKNDEHDTDRARSILTNCVMVCNEIFVKFVAFMVLSYILDSYRLSLWSVLVLAFLILFNFSINYLRMLLLKRNLFESAFSPISTVLILVIVMLFMFNYNSIDFDIYIKQTINFVGSVFDIPWKLVISGLFGVVLIPTFFLYFLIRLLFIFRGSISYGMKFWNFERNCKRFMIINLIAFSVIVISQIILNGSYSLWAFWNLSINNLEIVFAGLAVYFLSKNQGTNYPDVPSYDDIIKAEMEAQARELEALETEEIIETTETVDASIE